MRMRVSKLQAMVSPSWVRISIQIANKTAQTQKKTINTNKRTNTAETLTKTARQRTTTAHKQARARWPHMNTDGKFGHYEEVGRKDHNEHGCQGFSKCNGKCLVCVPYAVLYILQ